MNYIFIIMVNILYFSYGKLVYLDHETTNIVDIFEEYGDIVNYEL